MLTSQGGEEPGDRLAYGLALDSQPLDLYLPKTSSSFICFIQKLSLENFI